MLNDFILGPVDHIVKDRKLCKIDRCNSVYYTFFEYRHQWDTEKNGDMKDYMAGSNQKKHWLCDFVSHHTWVTTVNDRTRQKTGCPICSEKMLCPVNQCNSVYWTNIELRRQWNFSKNGDMKDYLPGSSAIKWWICLVDKHHEWSDMISNRTRRNYGCAICSNTLICPKDFCNSVWATNPELRDQWDSSVNGDMKTFTAGSEQKKTWICPKVPHHKWITKICHRTHCNGKDPPSGCPICQNTIVCPVDQCNSLYFYAPHLREEWIEEKNGDMKDYTPHSSKNAWWKCPLYENHVYNAQIINRTRTIKPSGCPKCLYKGEQKTREIFEKIFGVEFRNCHPKILEGLELDGYNYDLNIAFEFHGRQHYEFIEYFHKGGMIDFEAQKERDQLKIELCTKHNIMLIVVPHWEEDNLIDYIIGQLKETKLIKDSDIEDLKKELSEEKTMNDDKPKPKEKKKKPKYKIV